jgi:hypothetical protein
MPSRELEDPETSSSNTSTEGEKVHRDAYAELILGARKSEMSWN